MMRGSILLLVAPFLMGATDDVPASALGWMSGNWQMISKDGWTEEHWSSARGGMLLGTSRSGKGDRATEFEQMRIAADAGGQLTFYASPGGKGAFAFPLVQSGTREVVFENRAHDYPTRIAYRREGERLIAEISGPNGANPMRWTYERFRE